MTHTETGSLPRQELLKPPSARVSVFIASKRKHAAKLRTFRQDYPDIYFTARWPWVVELPSEQDRRIDEWTTDNTDDALRSQVFMIYAEPADILMNAIFEAGIAWAHDKHIWLVSGKPDVVSGDWAGYDTPTGMHPAYKYLYGRKRVHRAWSYSEAFKEIGKLAHYLKEGP